MLLLRNFKMVRVYVRSRPFCFGHFFFLILRKTVANPGDPPDGLRWSVHRHSTGGAIIRPHLGLPTHTTQQREARTSCQFVPAVHAFVTFLNTFAGISGDATVTFARPFTRIIDWASAQPQYYGETSLEAEHKVSFVEELFEDIGVQLKLAAARLQPVYAVQDLNALIAHTIQHGAKGFHLIAAADHDYGRKQAARQKFEEEQIGAMARRGAGTRAGRRRSLAGFR